ncbi:hypothetical protein [Streptomyces sp. NPDC052701]|uniref:hypothetical protein n=1 Tax=Streptomyces sp. NPDC052701 TaxID=3155533 RepID=UPI00343BD6CA
MRAAHTAMPWGDLVGSAQVSVRLTWSPLVGRLIGIDDGVLLPSPTVPAQP